MLLKIKEDNMRNGKKTPTWGVLVVGIMFLAFSLIMVWLYGPLMFGTKVTDINTLLRENRVKESTGKYVELDVDAVLENFAETVHKTNGFTTGKDQHFLVWLDDDSMIAVSVTGKNTTAMKNIMDATWEYLDGKSDSLTKTPLHLKGKIEEMSGQLLSYYREALEYFNLNEADRDIYYLRINCTDTQLLSLLITGGMFAFGVVMTLGYFKMKKKEKEEAQVIEGFEPQSQEPELG